MKKVAKPILGLIQHLPNDGEAWTEARRDQFLDVFNTVLDYCYPIKKEKALDPNESN